MGFVRFLLSFFILIQGFKALAESTCTPQSDLKSQAITMTSISCEAQCEYFYESNPETRPSQGHKNSCGKGALQAVADGLDPMACLKGLVDGAMSLQKLAAQLGSAVYQQRQAHRSMIDHCDKSPECRAEVVKNLEKYGGLKDNPKLLDQAKTMDIVSLLDMARQHRSSFVNYCLVLQDQVAGELKSKSLEPFEYATQRRDLLMKKDANCVSELGLEAPNKDDFITKKHMGMMASASQWLESIGIQIKCYPPEKVAELMCYGIASVLADPSIVAPGGVLAKKALTKALLKTTSVKTVPVKAASAEVAVQSEIGKKILAAPPKAKAEVNVVKSSADEFHNLGYTDSQYRGEMGSKIYYNSNKNSVIQLPAANPKTGVVEFPPGEKEKMIEAIEQGRNYKHPSYDSYIAQRKEEAIGLAVENVDEFGVHFNSLGYRSTEAPPGLVVFRNPNGSEITIPKSIAEGKALLTAAEKKDLKEALRENKSFIHPAAEEARIAGFNEQTHAVVSSVGAASSSQIRGQMRGLGYTQMTSRDGGVMVFKNEKTGSVITLPDALRARALSSSEKEDLLKALQENKNFTAEGMTQLRNRTIGSQGRAHSTLASGEGVSAANVASGGMRKTIVNAEEKLGIDVRAGGIKDSGTAATATSSHTINMRREYMPFAPEGTATTQGEAILHHELTHTTSIRKLNSGQANSSTVGRAIGFKRIGSNKFMGLDDVYGSRFRADEVEARIKEIGVYRRDQKKHGMNFNREIKDSISETRRFISVQRASIRNLLRQLPSSRLQTAGDSIVISVSDDMIEIPLAGRTMSEIEQRKYVEDILNQRLKDLDGSEKTLNRFEP